ncbi:MAG TPA: serine--tRNA ligase [Candidatus Polarisedimenticolia bacterium]|nr:serine--tRNA ligase [Candidatus Polarisedimenticolia bacterium]
MLDVNRIRNHPEELEAALRNRGVAADLSEFRRLDGARRSLLKSTEDLRARRNRASEEIARLKKEKNDASALIEEMKTVGREIAEAETRLGGIEESLRTLLLTLPNIPHASVPVGADASSNQEIRVWGERPVFDFRPRPHDEVGTRLGILDFERAAKVAGARFSLSTGAGARLERALINFMLDIQTKENGYTEALPPFIVNSASLVGTGNLPKFAADLFRLEGTDYYLIPTAEVPLTNIYRDEILEGESLPRKFVAYTPCFRSEAGSYGKDTKGLIRQHQFNKVEIVKFTRAEGSYDELESLTRDAESILQRLGLHYRVVCLATCDMGFSAAKTYDLEVWLPSQEAFREISSCSNFEDFQARRANIRYRPARKAKPEFVHTLNGSGLAVGRTLVAILENFQQQDGSVRIPEVLVPYAGFDRITPPA